MIIAGNWKMYKTRREAVAWVSDFLPLVQSIAPELRLRIYPAATALAAAAEAAAGTRLEVGAQNLHPEPEGAFTGEASAAMLLEAGAQSVLVGHSERRHVFGEGDSFLAQKVRAALAAGLAPLFCIGEDLAQREAGRTQEVLDSQVEQGLGGLEASDLDRVEIAYEPVWAIGTGRVAEPAQADEAHGWIRARLAGLFGDPGRRVPILYGGSVKPGNAAQLLGLPAVDGVLVGGASLDPEGFAAIASAGEKTA